MKPFYERIKSFWLPKIALSKVACTLYCILLLCAVFSTKTYAQTKVTITGVI
jgi:hypothetical protein